MSGKARAFPRAAIRALARGISLSSASLVVALLLAAALALAAGCERPAPAQFPHRAHLVTTACGAAGQPECASCVSCHAGIRASDERATDSPRECVRCHEPASDSVRAEARRLEEAATTAQPIAFEHPAHLALDEIRGQCVGCHPGTVDDGASGAVFPTMARCLACHRHDEQFSSGQCLLCHQRSDLRGRVPRTLLRHDLQFVRDHRAEAASRGRACSHCHAERDCAGCHESDQSITPAARQPDALDRELVHRADYLGRHAIDARSTPARCLRCHESSSCDGCHVQRGVSAARAGAVSPHPSGWIGSSSLAPSFHGAVARRELVTCAGCHDQGPATNCVRCHRVGGFGGNPHPSGWSSARSTSDGMCRYCHEP